MKLTMRMALMLTLLGCAGVPALAQDCASERPLTGEQQRAGWVALSGDGAKRLWTGGVGLPRPDDAWRFEGACLHLAQPARGGSLYSAESYGDFEIEFEWQISPGGNSGLKYACVPGQIHPDYFKHLFKPVGMTFGISLAIVLLLLWAILTGRSLLERKGWRRAGWVVFSILLLWCGVQAVTLVRGYRHAKSHPPGLEYQITDDTANEDAKSQVTHRSAALYDLLPPGTAVDAGSGQIHTSRVVVRGNSTEHWLDGHKALEYTLGSPELRRAVAGSKFAGLPGLAEKQAGLLELQNHGNEVWFRNMRIRRLM